MRNSLKVVALLVMAVVIVAALALLEIGPKRDGEPLAPADATPAPAPAPVRWVAAAPGRIEPRSGEVRVGSVAVGRIVEVLVQPRDRVAVGDLLIRLDDEEAKARVAAAKAEVALRTAVRDNQSAAETAERPPSPGREEAALAAARAELSLAEAVLEKTRIRAPAAGSVLQVAGKPGELALPSAEQTLVVLGDLSALRVRVEVDERDVDKVKVGQQVTISVDTFRGVEFAGKVAAIAPGLGPARINGREPRRPSDANVLEAVVDLDGTPPLLSGMRVDVYFRPDQPDQR